MFCTQTPKCGSAFSLGIIAIVFILFIEPTAKASVPDTKDLETSTKLAATLEKAKGAIDRETFSLDQKIEALNFDVESAIKYVVDDIDYMPYPGSMRGDIGTMATGSASSLDQALLLGGLLDTMGVDVMLAHGVLNAADTKRLIVSSLDVQTPKSAVDADLIASSSNQIEITAAKEAQLNNLDRVRKSLESTFSPSLGSTSSDIVNPIIEDVAKFYTWLRYRKDLSSPWVDVHPSFGRAAAPSPEVKMYSSVEVPKGRDHRFGFDLVLETIKNGKKSEDTLVSFEPLAISELASSQMTLAISPVGMDPTNVSGTQVANYFQPLVNGQSVKGANAFSARGQIVAASSLDSSQNASAAASLFGDLTQDLGANDKSNSGHEKHITGLFLIGRYVSPLGEQTRRRPLIDLSKTKSGDKILASDAILSLVFDVNIGQTNMARITDYQLSALSNLGQHIPYQRAVATGHMTLNDYAASTDVADVPLRPVWTAMAMQQSAFLPSRYNGSVVLPLTAVVSTHSRTMVKELNSKSTTLNASMDLMFTDAWVLEKNEAIGFAIDKNRTLSLGIDRTLAEAVLMKGQGEVMRFEQANRLLKINSQERLSNFFQDTEVNARARARMTDDLELSGLIFVNQGSIGKAQHWWMLEPDTGAVLGMGIGGGNEMASYAISYKLSRDSAVSVAFFVVGNIGCFYSFAIVANKGGQASMASLGSCLTVNAGLAAAGFVIGTGLLHAEAALAKSVIGLASDLAAYFLGEAAGQAL